MVQPINESTRQQLLALTPSGDLMDLARRLRQQGVESLLICHPQGRITQVVTDRQIAQLASPGTNVMTRFAVSVPGQPGPAADDEAPVLPQSRRSEDDGLVGQELVSDDLGQVTGR